MKKWILRFGLLLSLAALLAPNRAFACACGCGVFEVGTASMLPTHPGGMAFVEYDELNQNRNWSRYSRGSDDDNADKLLRTNFFTAGVQYMVNRSWGLQAELPYWNRTFRTTDDSGAPLASVHSAVGDIRLRGIYTGFSGDMSSGLTFGLKLPTGDFSFPDFDRDTEIGTGSTDLLLGAFRVGRVPSALGWAWFANAVLDQPVLTAGGYRPGGELDAAIGGYYDRTRLGDVTVAPVAQLVGSHRLRDSGTLGHFTDSGYDRILLAPGLEFDTALVRVYGDVGFPLYQYVHGNQLVAKALFKLNVGYRF